MTTSNGQENAVTEEQPAGNNIWMNILLALVGLLVVLLVLFFTMT